MAEAASINFQKIHSAMHAVNHASRQTPPKYLLPDEYSIGAFCIKDDKAAVHFLFVLALAYRRIV